MSEFGKRLRHYRECCVDQQSGKGKLSQTRLGELLGRELGLMTSIPFQTISRWENGQPNITAGDRQMQLALIKVLHRNGGIQSVEEADELLNSGNFLGLRSDETQLLLHKRTNGHHSNGGEIAAGKAQAASPANPDWTVGSFFARVHMYWDDWVARYGSGQPPHWPAVLLGALGSFRPRPRTALTAILWVVVWYLTWWALFPLMHWPFADDTAAVQAAIAFGIGMVGLPILITGLAHPWGEVVWQEHPEVKRSVIRLYALQGAWIGYQIGGLGLFAIALSGYHLGFSKALPMLEQVGSLIPLILSYAVARRLPHDLWRAFGRLHLADGGVAFIGVLLGPGWAIFFLYTSAELLAPFWGALILLLASLSAAGLVHWQHQRSASMVIPVHWWIVIYGSILAASLYRETHQLAGVVYLIGLLLVLVQAMARGQVLFTWPGALGLALGLGLVGLGLSYNPWIGRGLAALLFVAWVWVGRRYIHIPLAFWLTAVAASACEELTRIGRVTGPQSLLVFSGIVVSMFLWERFRTRPT